MEHNQLDGGFVSHNHSAQQPQQQVQQQYVAQSSSSTNNMNMMDAANKRAALAGQWRTPPMPVFPSGTTIPAAPTALPPKQQQQGSVKLTQLPDSTEDYAKALQEAYRRGAEAAQAMAQQRSLTPGAAPHIIPSASCPDLQQQDKQQSRPHLMHSASAINVPSLEAPSPSSLTGGGGNVPNPLSTLSSSHLHPAPSGVVPVAAPIPIPLPPVMGNVVPTPLPAPMAPGASSHMAQALPPTQRSMSLPDMSTYAAQQEEEKRQKRLARNRASARLRRLRKKNLVEAYEQEVGILEKTLSQLQAHEWGETDNAAALTEALSMDRGQQVLTYAQRHEAATGLLDQQHQWIEMLEEIMMEDYVLQNVRNGEFAELRDILGLDEEQLNQIEASKVGWEEEWSALQILKGSLIALRENDWLWNEDVSAIAEQFMSILHKNQVSKFLLWADHNAEAIDELDGVNAYPGTPNGPVFAFGVESQPGENYGEEDK